MQVLSLAGTAEKQAASALVLLRLGSHSARLLAQTDCTPGGQKEEMFHWPEGELQKLEGLLLNLVEGLAVGILASDHYKLHTVCEEPLAMAVLRRQAAGSPDIQAEVAHKEAPREYAGLHSLYSHPQTNFTSAARRSWRCCRARLKNQNCHKK